ncbi:hypothetical protein DER44DRAFT_710312, partial [Fusarium oxysporum]
MIEFIPSPRKKKIVLAYIRFRFDGNPVKVPKTAYLTGCSYKSPTAQTEYTGLVGGQLTT